VNRAVLIEAVRDADPAPVVDPTGGVMGTENLFVADASVMPEVWRTNTNIPTVMIAERVAEIVRQRGIA
jgi:5-(hydroxymethyl)furfural/furfural oxidase